MITLEEYKTMMGITSMTPEEEAQINLLILQSKSIIDNIIGDVTIGERTEKIPYRDVFFENSVIKLYTTKIGISEVISIDGEPYEDEYKTDGKHNHIVYIKPPYKSTEYPFLELWVINWFDPIPDDLKLMQAYMIKNLANLSNDKSWVIKKKKIGDKELQFASNTNKNEQDYINDVLLSYRILSV